MRKVLAAALLAAPITATAAPIDLGAAGDYTLLAVGGGGTHLSLGSQAQIFGNVGGRNNVNADGTVKIHGNEDRGKLAATSIAVTDGAKNLLSGSQWNNIIQDMVDASQKAASSPGEDRGAITTTTTLLAKSGQMSVFNVNGEINLATGESLTLKGEADDQFVVNVTGNFKFGSGVSLNLDGIFAHNVLFNFTGGSSFETGGSKLSGTFLAPEMSMNIGDGATLEQVRFLGRTIDANVQDVRGITPPPVSVPEPVNFAMFGIAMAGLLLARRKTKQ